MDTVVTHREIDVPSLPLKRIPSILYNILYIQKTLYIYMFICVLYCHSYYVNTFSHHQSFHITFAIFSHTYIIARCIVIKKKKDAYMGNIFDTLAARRSS